MNECKPLAGGDSGGDSGDGDGARPEVTIIVDFKEGGDNFGYNDFKGRPHKVEQWAAYLLFDGQLHNDYKRIIPLGGAHPPPSRPQLFCQVSDLSFFWFALRAV